MAEGAKQVVRDRASRGREPNKGKRGLGDPTMLQPSRAPSSARRIRAGSKGAATTSGATLSFGQFGLKAMEPDRLTARQIEAARRAMTRHMKRAGRVWIRIFPDVPVSKKPLEVRMGKGKGTPELWVVPGQAGPHPVRDRRRPQRRSRARRFGSPPPSCRCDQDALHRAHCRVG